MTISPESRMPRPWIAPARLLAAGFGSGWLPGAPGTWGSLASLPFAAMLLTYAGPGGLMAATLLLLAAGCVACAIVLPELADQDPGWIVIDEWAGQWLCLALIGHVFALSLLNLALAFAAFRLFDILKPFPIRHVEHLGPGWWSIMADDLVAGLMGAGMVVAGLLLAGMGHG